MLELVGIVVVICLTLAFMPYIILALTAALLLGGLAAVAFAVYLQPGLLYVLAVMVAIAWAPMIRRWIVRRFMS